MNYQSVVDTRHLASTSTAESPAVQERRILQSCGFLALCGLLLLLLFPSLRAQDLYTEFNLPKVGARYVRSWAPPIAVDPQAGGLGQSWDFRSLTSVLGKRDTIRFVSPVGLPGVIPPKTTVVVTNSTTAGRVFYNTSKPSLAYLGEDDSDKRLIMGSDPFDIEPIPIKFGALLTSKYSATIQFPKIPAQTIRRRTTVTFSPDGEGELLLPGAGTNDPSIRVHWTEDIVDTVLLNNKAQYVAHSQVNRYVWYGAKSAIEYLSIKEGQVSFTRIGGTPPKDSLFFETRFVESNSVSGIENTDDASIQVFPMPASSVIHIDGIEAGTGQVRASLFSMHGELLAYVERGPDADGPLNLNIKDCAAQSCVLRIDVGGRRIVRKVVITR